MRYTLMVNVRIYIVIIDVDHKVYHYQKGVFVIVQATLIRYTFKTSLTLQEHFK